MSLEVDRSRANASAVLVITILQAPKHHRAHVALPKRTYVSASLFFSVRRGLKLRTPSARSAKLVSYVPKDQHQPKGNRSLRVKPTLHSVTKTWNALVIRVHPAWLDQGKELFAPKANTAKPNFQVSRQCAHRFSCVLSHSLITLHLIDFPPFIKHLNLSIHPVEPGDDKLCLKGFYCPESSTDKQEKSSKSSQDCLQGQSCLCHEVHWCPPGSTRKTGKPMKIDNTDPIKSCSTGTDCQCPQGFICPRSSTSPKGKPSVAASSSCDGCGAAGTGSVCGECPCPEGYFCTSSIPQTKQLCKAGSFCPVTSTAENGQPAVDQVAAETKCAKGSPCLCSDGYVCPQGSTANTGRRMNDATITDGQGYSPGSDCKCPKGHYCQKGVKALVNPGYYSNQEGNSEAKPPTKKCAGGFFCPSGERIH